MAQQGLRQLHTCLRAAHVTWLCTYHAAVRLSSGLETLHPKTLEVALSSRVVGVPEDTSFKTAGCLRSCWRWLAPPELLDSLEIRPSGLLTPLRVVGSPREVFDFSRVAGFLENLRPGLRPLRHQSGLAQASRPERTSTLCTFEENTLDRVIEEDDILAVDLGPGPRL
ncbi:hypothetical protein E4U61_005603 [Claviceps capensis]|nr:hypothetical protein E4U61_005603 [Claviceps capensis]